MLKDYISMKSSWQKDPCRITVTGGLWQYGVYTVEMSLILPLILGIISMLIYLGFYVNDRVVLEEAVKEAAIYSTANYPEDFEAANKIANEKFNEITEKRLFAINNLSLSTYKKDCCLVMDAKCEFKIPMFAELRKNIFGSDMIIKASGKGAITKPVAVIQTVKFVEGVVKGDS